MNTSMIRKVSAFLLAAVFACLMAWGAVGGNPSPLVGTWSFKSLTALQNGKPFGTVHLKQGQVTTTFRPDGTWVTDTTIPNPHQLTGTYQIHGDVLEMKRSDGKPYSTDRFKVEQDGKELSLTNKEQVLTARREPD